jgi:hypothetical protein
MTRSLAPARGATTLDRVALALERAQWQGLPLPGLSSCSLDSVSQCGQPGLDLIAVIALEFDIAFFDSPA